MFVLDSGVVCSPSDLTRAVECEFGWLRALDHKLGRVAAVDEPGDPMLARTAKLGDAFEARVLGEFAAKFGDYDPSNHRGVFGVERPTGGTGAIALAAAITLDVLRTGADVIYQGAFYGDGFLGYSDFLVAEDGRWAVYDTKLARHAKVPALLQIAAYADVMRSYGVPVADDAYLLLGDGSTSTHRVADIVPVYRERRARLDAIAAERLADDGPVAWGDPRYTACGRCSACAAEVEAHRDLLLVANLRLTQRAKLIAAGIETIDALAANTAPVSGLSVKTLGTLTAQARLQVQQAPPGDEPSGEVSFDVFAPSALAVLPEPSLGDIFFDFEGDPLWSDGDLTQNGLEYLFGVIEAPTSPDATPTFVAFWAHSRAEERQALIDFLDYVAARRAKYPDMRIYHYAAYEKTALLRLAGRYGVGEDEVDDLLRHNVLVDLYSVVRSAVRVSQPSYSIKKLEPLYMGDQLRTGDVTTAGASIDEYVRYCDLRDAGQTSAAADALQSIADYNEYDCVSTLRLRDWLLAQAVACGVAPASSAPVEDEDGTAGAGPIAGAPELRDRLTADFADLPRTERTAGQQARALLAASLGYHQREEKPFWWAHFDRLQHPIDEWADTSGVLVVEHAEVVTDWAKTDKQRRPHRTLRLTGPVGDGVEVPDEVFVLYDSTDLPNGVTAVPGYRGTTNGNVVARPGDDPDVVEVDEINMADTDGGAALPVALAPRGSVRTGTLRDAITEVAAAVADGSPTPSAIFDLLQRRAPRLTGGGALPASEGPPDARLIAEVVAGLDDSYLAIQGPPGSGKTYTGARVVTALAELGWKIGVVAQSHRVVENFLDGVASAGLPADRIGKRCDSATGWTALKDKEISGWLADHDSDGCVLGGTAWDFVNASRVRRGQLDLLVIDEAGQFSLANTIAVSVAARRMLLLGDPQQLPQVSQGTHPEPCDESALAWVMGEHHVMPADRGYFLSRSWRMHPALCSAVSTLAYDGQLESVASAEDRRLVGVEPGIETVEVEHYANSTSSVEEAGVVVTQVGRFLGKPWSEDGSPERPLTQGDVLVVAAYNAQVSTIRGLLDQGGFTDVRVGTVDKFQGQEAPVVLVSMAASAPSEVPRGMTFLLSRNRVNVAVSRAKWCTVIIRSPQLTDYLPSTPHALAELGAFIGLCSSPA